MTSPSFERVNYLLRPNKNIERKMIFDRLAHIGGTLDFRGCRYVGFGSLWFVDFVLAHRMLKIQDMLSIENPEYAERADFNRPYSSIEVRPGWSTDILNDMQEAEWERPQVVWFDYDGTLDDTVVADLEILIRKLSAGSVLLLSVNGTRRSYRRTPAGGKGGLTSVDALKGYLGEDAIASEFELTADAFPDVSEAQFPAFLAASLLNFIRRKIRTSGRQEGENGVSFIPSFNFCHIDGVEMVTVGGVLVESAKVEEAEQMLVRSGVSLDDSKTPKHAALDLIQLTAKEKSVLDRLLPSGADGFEARAQGKGLCLPNEQYAKYRDHYLYFPVFAETHF